MVSVGRGATHRGGCRIDTPKSGKARTVTIPPHIRADVSHHLATHVAKDPEAQLFPAERGGCHLNDKVFREYLRTALESVGRQDVRVHDLRHFAGTQMARVGNLKETMERLGHSTVKASLIYQQVVSGRPAEIAEALLGAGHWCTRCRSQGGGGGSGHTGEHLTGLVPGCPAVERMACPWCDLHRAGHFNVSKPLVQPTGRPTDQAQWEMSGRVELQHFQAAQYGCKRRPIRRP